MNTSRSVAVSVLNLFEKKDIFLRDAFQIVFRDCSDIQERDRRLSFEIAYGTLRYRLQLDWFIGNLLHAPIETLDIETKNILRIGLYQLRFLDRVPAYAVIHSCVELVRAMGKTSKAGLVNAVLRSYQRKLLSISWPNEEEAYLSVYYSYPEELVRRFLSVLGKNQTIDLLRLGNQKPVLSLRVNALKMTRDNLIQKLHEEGVPAQKCPQHELIVHLQSWMQVEDLELFQEGAFQIQDETALGAVEALQAGIRQKVLDLCAAPGGKTTAIAQMQSDSGYIVSWDSSRDRMKQLLQNMKRLGLKSIYPVVGDASLASISLKRTFDRILLDVPCTNTGVLSKRVEARYRFSLCQLERLVKLQQQLFAEACQLLGPGGILVYSTCSIDPAENQELVSRFLDNNAHLRLLDSKSSLPGQCHDGGYWAKITKIQDTGYRMHAL